MVSLRISVLFGTSIYTGNILGNITGNRMHILLACIWDLLYYHQDAIHCHGNGVQVMVSILHAVC